MFVLDAYAARSCPLKAFNLASPSLSRPPASSRRAPLPGSVALGDQVVARLLACGASTADLRGTADKGQACLDAMEAGTDVIVAGMLPDDRHQHRRGRPPLLVRDPGTAACYRPAVVRFQRVWRSGGSLEYSRLETPLLAERCDGHSYRWASRADNVMGLAHYWRMLETLGHASGTPVGAIASLDEIDGSPVLTWLALDTDGLLARYDAEFAEQTEFARQAEAGASADDLGLEPVMTPECDRCDWRPVCRARLGDDDLSVRVPHSRLSRADVLRLREVGVRTAADLAEADMDTLLERLSPPGAATAPAGDDPDAPGAQHHDDPLSSAAKNAWADHLMAAQHRARLVLAGVALERIGSGPVPVPGASLEIDIDLETSSEDRVYLWGFLVSDAATGECAYHPFAEFSRLDDDAETALAGRALAWLRERVEGRDALVYHYSDYETLRIARLATRSGDPRIAWAHEWARTGFIDLFAPVRQHFFGANGIGLKVVAHAGAGFSWRDHDPSGLASMAWFEDALAAPTPDERDDARRRLLDYNEDDVRATLAVRRWLRSLQ